MNLKERKKEREREKDDNLTQAKKAKLWPTLVASVNATISVARKVWL